MTSQKNSFKAIDDEQISNFSLFSSKVEEDVNSHLGVLSMVGSAIDLYLPRVVKFFIYLFGGEETEQTVENKANDSIAGEAIQDND